MIRYLLCSLVLAALIPVATVAVADRVPFGDELSTVKHGPDRTVDVQHYLLDLTFDPSRAEVRGTVSITLSPLVEGLAVVELDAGPMEISGVTLDLAEGGQALEYRHDGRKLRIDLPRALSTDETVTLSVSYSAQPRAGLYFVGPDDAFPDRPAQVWSQGEGEDNHLWFPSFDYPNDRATSEEIYTVPANWTAVGNGKLLEVSENVGDGTRTFHYRMGEGHVTYLVSVIAGEFEKYTDDFDGIPVEYFVPVGTGEATARRSFGTTPEILEVFSEKTGVRYPYSKYSQACAVDFIYGGMENISATTQNVDTLHDEIAALERDSEGLVAHEAAHQWYGDLLTCADWSHAWLNEGFANFLEKLWWEHREGPDRARYDLLLDRDSYLEEDRADYRRPIVSHLYTDSMDVFDSHLYAKGAWVVHMTRGILGDEAFFKALAHYTRKHRGGIVESVDFRRAIAEATGVNLEGFFDQWLHHGGHPEFEITREWDAEARLLTVHVAQVQKVDELTPIFKIPVDLAIDTAEGTFRHRLQLTRAEHDLTLRLESEPLLVRFDPDFNVLCEVDIKRPVREMVRALEQDPSAIGRIFAVRDLAEKAPMDAASEALDRTLREDGFYGVRIEAAKALGKVGGDAARDALVTGLADADARVRTAAATALGEFRDDGVAEKALLGVIDSERAYGTYGAAVLSLAKIGSDQADKMARRALRLDSDREQIRTRALQALTEVGDDEAFATILEWTAYDKPARARRTAIPALAEIEPEGPQRTEAIRTLIDLLDDPSLRARRTVITTLGRLRASEALGPLARSASVEPDSRLRKAARTAIRKINEGAGGGTSVDELAAEVERLRLEVRSQSDRIKQLESE